MLLSGISLGSTALQALGSLCSSRGQGVRGEFQKLGEDLQSGNLTKAQSDYTTLSQDLATRTQGYSQQLTQELSTLGQALQSGSLSTAQTAYAALQHGLQQSSALSATTAVSLIG